MTTRPHSHLTLVCSSSLTESENALVADLISEDAESLNPCRLEDGKLFKFYSTRVYSWLVYANGEPVALMGLSPSRFFLGEWRAVWEESVYVFARHRRAGIKTRLSLTLAQVFTEEFPHLKLLSMVKDWDFPGLRANFAIYSPLFPYVMEVTDEEKAVYKEMYNYVWDVSQHDFSRIDSYSADGNLVQALSGFLVELK